MIVFLCYLSEFPCIFYTLAAFSLFVCNTRCLSVSRYITLRDCVKMILDKHDKVYYNLVVWICVIVPIFMGLCVGGG